MTTVNVMVTHKEADMHRRFGIGIVIGLLLVVSSPLMAITLDEIIDQYVEARGGLEAWHKLQTMRIEGMMTMTGPSGSMEAPLLIEAKRPDKFRMEFTMQGITGIQAVDGDKGWTLMPFTGQTKPEPMADEVVGEFSDQMDFEGPLFGYQDKGHTVELIGTEEVDGTEAHKLKITKESGTIIYSYIDTEYFLELKNESTRKVMGVETSVTTVYGDYKEVGDLLIPHSMDVSFATSPMTQTITLTSIELDADIADERFAMPVPEEPEEKPPAEADEPAEHDGR